MASFIVLSIDLLSQRVLTPLAQSGRGRVARYDRHVAPAALALHTGGTLDCDPWPCVSGRAGIVGRWAQLHFGDDEEHGQLACVWLEPRQVGLRRGHDHSGLERAADLLLLAERLDFGDDPLAELDQHLPLIDELRIAEWVQVGG